MGDATRGPDVTDQEILAVFANSDDQRLTTREAVAELPIPEENLIDRLEDLYERGLLARDDEVEPGERWRLTSDGEDAIDVSDDEVESQIEAQASKTTGTETTPREVETSESPPPDPQEDTLGPLHESVVDAIELFEPPGDVEETEPRRDALRYAYDYVRRSERAERGDLVSDVFPDASGAYEEPEQWWEELIRPGLGTLPGVESSGDGEAWRFTGVEGEGQR